MLRQHIQLILTIKLIVTPLMDIRITVIHITVIQVGIMRPLSALALHHHSDMEVVGAMEVVGVMEVDGVMAIANVKSIHQCGSQLGVNLGALVKQPEPKTKRLETLCI